jgi:hypothetical protein
LVSALTHRQLAGAAVAAVDCGDRVAGGYDVNVRRIGWADSAGLHASANRHIPAAARVPPPRGDTPWAICSRWLSAGNVRRDEYADRRQRSRLSDLGR